MWSLAVLYRGVLLTSILFAVVLLVSTTAVAQSAPNCSSVNYDGLGTTNDPYRVSDVDELQCIENQGLNDSYILVSDIDASETSRWNGNKGFEPIGDDTTYFNGTFEGASHNITGLVIDRPSEDQVGLFGGAESGSSIRNIALKDLNITGGNLVGGLVGDNKGGTVSYSNASGKVKGSGGVGGLVGGNEGGTVSHSNTSGEVNGSVNVGGLVGGNIGDISYSHSRGNVTGSKNAGGLLGVAETGNVSSSYATGSVSGSENVGGLVGQSIVQVSDKYAVSDSYATGDVDGVTQVGGLVGITLGPINISESYATGYVDGSFGVGGLVGANAGNLFESYSTGGVNGSGNVGGLIGVNLGEVSNSYAIGNVSGNVSVGGLIGSNTQLPITGNSSVSESYAAGRVSGNQKVGGLIGNGDAGTLNDSYWDEEKTEQSEAVGREEPAEMVVAAIKGLNTSNMQGDGWTPAGPHESGSRLNTSNMQGDAAETNMTAFNFTTRWRTVTNPADYPVLAWQKNGLDQYRNQQGEVDLQGLQQAIDDFTNDRIDLAILQNVIDEFVAS